METGTEQEIAIRKFNRAAKKAIWRCGTFSFTKDGIEYNIEQDRKQYSCRIGNSGSCSIADTPFEAWSDC